jgi:hypothetical protein
LRTARSTFAWDIQAWNHSRVEKVGAFDELLRYAVKRSTFEQDKAITALDPQREANQNSIGRESLSKDQFDLIEGGVCAALSCDWLHDRLTSVQKDTDTDKKGADVHQERNLKTTLAATPNQIKYKQQENKDVLFKEYKLGKRLDVGNPERGSDDTHDTLARACSDEYLKKGTGVYITVKGVLISDRTKSGFHAVAAYRSRGNQLYFFDSNCGVYQVSQPLEFFEAWVKGYTKREKSMSIYIPRDGPFVYFKRQTLF